LNRLVLIKPVGNMDSRSPIDLHLEGPLV
jgi:hypothetical protein